MTSLEKLVKHLVRVDSTSVVWRAGCQKNKAELHLLCPFTAARWYVFPVISGKKRLMMVAAGKRKDVQAGCQKSKAVLRSASLFYGSLLVRVPVISGKKRLIMVADMCF
ncbi:hypothetical protein DSO57_1012266 [Entomophthora muscae]|uniref:Uncharacterized protein n=1 Tax=Entomophthora muscae TaxID=34485 RepID=A0ACC2RX49_9FUNG|nr:hypothetical protein DSO57_1012266 [Entomophthora muscae]